MGRLRITKHTEKVVTDWTAGAPPRDRELVEELLAAIEDKSAMQGRFSWEHDATDPSITVFQPREGLFVLVRMWTDDPAENQDQFDVLAIVDAEDIRNDP